MSQVFIHSIAAKLQKKLSELVSIGPDPPSVQRIAGLDVSYRGKNFGVAVAVVVDTTTLEILDCKAAKGIVNIPYVPGFLAFREAPLMIAALESLDVKPDVVMVNGHGLAHPRKLGIASHIGVVLDIPSIGVARHHLYGRIVQEGQETKIVVDDRVVGYVIRTPQGGKLYVSVGHKVTPEFARDLVIKMFRPPYSLPEPIRLADQISRRIVHAITHS